MIPGELLPAAGEIELKVISATRTATARTTLVQKFGKAGGLTRPGDRDRIWSLPLGAVDLRFNNPADRSNGSGK